MLSRLIKNIRAKPESVRRGITLGTSLGITGIVGFFWLISFLNYSSEVLLAKPKAESPTSFLNKMGTLIGESYANVRSKIGDENSFVSKDTVQASTSDAVAVEMFQTEVEETQIQETSVSSAVDTRVDSSTDVSTSQGDTSTSVDLQDILNTKKKDNQENKATTSSEVLVQ